MYSREVWTAEGHLLGLSASGAQVERIEHLLSTCALPDTEVQYWQANAAHLLEDQAAALIRKLEENQAESSDPRQQFIQRSKLMP